MKNSNPKSQPSQILVPPIIEIGWDQWLNENLSITFEQASYLLHNHTILETIEKVWREQKNKEPFIAMGKKIFICREIPHWEEMTVDHLKNILQIIQQRLSIRMDEWRDKYPDQEDIYQKGLIKSMFSLNDKKIIAKTWKIMQQNLT